MKKVSYIDTSVLIAAFRGEDAVAERALEVLGDPDREYASSAFVKLEALPKPHYNRMNDELEFYRAFFESVAHWAEPIDQIVVSAQSEAERCGLAAMDALHVASAAAVGADELLTGEGRTKPMHRTGAVNVVSIRGESTESGDREA